MSLLFYVILFYIIFLPLSEFINTDGTIYTREKIRESSPATNPVFSRVCGEFNNKI